MWGGGEGCVRALLTAWCRYEQSSSDGVKGVVSGVDRGAKSAGGIIGGMFGGGKKDDEQEKK